MTTKKKQEGLGMKKTIARTILALCIALSVFMCNSSLALAYICPNSPLEGKVHYFTVHVRANAGYFVDLENHTYVFGYDANHNPIYMHDCNMSHAYDYCKWQCSYCTTFQPGGDHIEDLGVRHSVSHQ